MGLRRRELVTRINVVSVGFMEEVTLNLKPRKGEVHQSKVQAEGEYMQRPKSGKILFYLKNL